MKHKVPVLLFLVFFSLTSIFAGPVNVETAGSVARNFLYEQLVKKGVAVTFSDVAVNHILTEMSGDQPAYHIFGLNHSGFVIVSGEDAYTPVIGYSLEAGFPGGKLDDNYSSFLAGYRDQIDFIRAEAVTQDASVREAWDYWQSLPVARYTFGGERSVDPLIATLWNQDFPYNAYCPTDAGGSGGHVYAGCVATAMSMIMAYYRYPLQGTGSYNYNYGAYGNISANFGETTYDWDAMLNSITSGSGRAINAIAELQFHCGVSVRMMYGPDGSGAYSEDVPYAIRTYFGYSSSAQHVRKSFYSLSVWENMITTSLDELKPLYYSGQSSEGGHAFVLDGYQTGGTGNMYHFNFGWSGSGNGFYTLNDVGGYSGYQAMVRNFFPNPANYPFDCEDHLITSPMGSFEDRSGPLQNYASGKACSWLIAPEDSVTSITLSFNMFDLAAGDAVNIYDGENAAAPLLASYNSGTSAESVASTGNRLFVEFITDDAEEAQGFNAQFNSTFPSFCSGTINLTDPTGGFSDGSGDFNYNNNSMCKWKIDPGPFATGLTLAFSEFDLEQDKDYLKVYAIPTNQLIANLTGSEIPEPIVSPTGKMLLLFTSNGFNNHHGFSAEYYIENVSTHQVAFATNLAIFPNPANGYTEVKFSIKESMAAEFAITDLTGRTVYSESGMLNQGHVSRIIRFGDLRSGIYLLHIRTSAGTLSGKLIVE